MPAMKKKRAAAKPKKATTASKPKAVKAVKAAKVVKAKKTTAIQNPMTKSEMFADIADSTGLSKRDVAAVFTEFASLIERHIAKRGPGMMKVPGLMKIEVKERPATKARKGINPFTGEEIMIKAKPKRRTVKIRPLKTLKDMAE